jgi:hypothetical protein
MGFALSSICAIDLFTASPLAPSRALGRPLLADQRWVRFDAARHPRRRLEHAAALHRRVAVLPEMASASVAPLSSAGRGVAVRFGYYRR